jgi:hypothetical protein
MTPENGEYVSTVGASTESAPRSSAAPSRFLTGDGLPGTLTAVGIGLFATDDFSLLRSWGGGLLASPGWIPILLAAVIVLRRAHSVRNRWVLATLAGVWCYGLVLTAVTLPLVPSELLAQSTLGKAAKLLLTTAVLISMIIAGGLLTRHLKKWVLIGAVIAFSIMVISGLLSHFGIQFINNWSVIHSTVDTQMRVRGTRYEPSSLGGGILALGCLIAVLLPRPWGSIFLALTCVISYEVPESRGTTVVSVIGFVLSVVWFLIGGFAGRMPRLYLNAFAGLVAVAALLSSLGIDFLLGSQLWRDAGLANSLGSTSDATRSVWSAASFDTLLQYPFGMGYGAYLSWLPDVVRHAIAHLSGLFSSSTFRELRSTLSSGNDETLSPKTLPDVAVTYLGWVGLAASAVLYFVSARTSVRLGAKGGLAAFPAVVVVILVSTTYFWSVFSWDQMFFFGAILLGLAVDTEPRETYSLPGLESSANGRRKPSM